MIEIKKIINILNKNKIDFFTGIPDSILKSLYGLPSKVFFCKKTLISNQRPASTIEFFHNRKTKKETLFIDKNNLITKISRVKKSDLYCSGIQILNLKLIIRDLKKCDDFNSVWKQLINKKKIYCGFTKPHKWYSVDNTNQLKKINNK